MPTIEEPVHPDKVVALRSVPSGQRRQELTTAARSCVAWALEWTPEQEIPAEIAPHLGATVATMTRLMAGPTLKQFAVLVDPLFRFARNFNIPVTSVEETSAIYFAQLRGIPADLLATAIERVQGTHEAYSRMPLPSEIAKLVDGELGRRVLARGRLGIALSRISTSATSTAS